LRYVSQIDLDANGESGMTAEPSSIQDHPLNPARKAVIVGASSGIGAALARKLAAEGYHLGLLARRKKLLNELCAEINHSVGVEVAFAYPHDVTKFKQIPDLFRQILTDMQNIDLFIYNSGMSHTIGMSEYDFDKDLETLNVNLIGGIAWLNEAATLFDRMESGQLVGISSIAGDRGRVGNPSYMTAKSGMSTYLESLRNRLARKGVHVLTVKPGYVQTELLPEKHPPLPVATPEDTANVIYRAIKRRKQVIYTPWWWRFIMLIVTHTPSFIFRRMSF
jgi:short-subunit dehydrogenase